MTEREKAMSAMRKLLEPAFRDHWNRALTMQDRRWFLECAGIDRSSRTLWGEFNPEQQAKIRRAYAEFMRGGSLTGKFPLLAI